MIAQVKKKGKINYRLEHCRSSDWSSFVFGVLDFQSLDLGSMLQTEICLSILSFFFTCVMKELCVYTIQLQVTSLILSYK